MPRWLKRLMFGETYLQIADDRKKMRALARAYEGRHRKETQKGTHEK